MLRPMLTPAAINAAPKKATQKTWKGIQAGMRLAMKIRARKWSMPKMIMLTPSSRRLARVSQADVVDGLGSKNARQASERGSKTIVRRGMLPTATAYLGTLRMMAHTKRIVPSVIAALRREGGARRPAAQKIRTAPKT